MLPRPSASSQRCCLSPQPSCLSHCLVISTVLRLLCADAVTSRCFIVTFAAVREHQFLQGHLPAVMLYLLHHHSELTPLLAGRHARWVGTAPRSCSASQEVQPVAWFSIKEIKDKDIAVNKGQSTELCPLPALLQLQRATLGRSVPLQLHFPGQPCSCLLTVTGVWSPGWAGVGC